ncbi:hypothetical protein HS041_25335 [Planomonospora sp. ID67723]|uniref:hypothetical protein n=1 Tax=Planomonospora sp. ID67723 TaxID=2738134 RepID=UPI0018C42858|nr:hypothetical protein [Planomonospora sp. ID67723]MBG0831088.1 hypothetical protein [Planomonospora sp. ID67723]
MRSAPDGTRVTVDLPVEAGAIEWHGHTRFAGPGLVRDFQLAPAGHRRAIPSKIFPGGREETFRRHGFDLVLYEAADRSDSCLVWAGPYHEATTWFGGPAPRRLFLNRLIAAVDFTDSPEGAKITPRIRDGVQQHGTMLIGANDGLLLMASDARVSRESLPAWRGAVQGNAEVWREELDLDPDQKAALAGTPYEWRYTFANPTTVFTLVFSRDPDQAGITARGNDATVDAVLGGINVMWAA